MSDGKDAQDPSQLRISDSDRHKVAEVLREAAGEGRIDFEELDQRLEATYAARTYADLVPITLDLPVHGAANLPTQPATASMPSPVVAGGPAEERHLAIMSGLERKGVWTVPARMTVNCFMGGADLDLRRAQFAAQEVVITINAVMGGADIKVNPHTEVIMEGTGIMGGYSGPSGHTDAELDANSPVVRIRGFALMGGVSVSRRRAPGAPSGPGRELRPR
ncbi:MAG TPA: DUF1707 domain-containing protein [Nocardioides sp.]|uniref:DUF1707 SHOCT-like domain-containing protein n=1 Tax=Nocardioides sp. TaxID=35761 RepID=UPI002F3F2F50